MFIDLLQTRKLFKPIFGIYHYCLVSYISSTVSSIALFRCSSNGIISLKGLGNYCMIIIFYTLLLQRARQRKQEMELMMALLLGEEGGTGGSRSTASLTSPSRIFLPCCLPTPALVPLTWLYCYIKPPDLILVTTRMDCPFNN